VLDADISRGKNEFGVQARFSFHTIDLRPDLETIYRRFHESCVRRKIKRAEREKLTLEYGKSKDLLDKFRHLLLLTRRRHKLPPQPAEWFTNLADCLGDKLTIHLLSKDGAPVASILTLTYKKTLIYKYGCSDAQFHNLGGMPLLFWIAIQEGKRAGLQQFDLGRSAPDDPGLIAFKGHLGAITSELKYYRAPAPRARRGSSRSGMQWVQQALACLPDPVLVGAGNWFYRHLG
jgi:lipid II:glycine glycyltransferase (peptidoglycan interpeptide bridge formation enzyme)